MDDQDSGSCGTNLAGESIENLAATEAVDAVEGLLPCPFCGSAANFSKHPLSKTVRVECGNEGCNALIPWWAKNESGAKRFWNSRAHGDWFDTAIRYMRGDPSLTDCDMRGSELEAFIKFWDSESPNFRSCVKSVFVAAPHFTAKPETSEQKG